MKVIDVPKNSLFTNCDLDTTTLSSSTRNERMKEFLELIRDEFYIPPGGPIDLSGESAIHSSLSSRKQVRHLGAEDQSSHRISDLFKQTVNIQI